jgi:hypothetical protein
MLIAEDQHQQRNHGHSAADAEQSGDKTDHTPDDKKHRDEGQIQTTLSTFSW